MNYRVLFLLFCSLCSACVTVSGNVPGAVASVNTRPLSLAMVEEPVNESFLQCEDIVSKRIVYVLFVLPVNVLTADEIKGGSGFGEFHYRVNEIISPGVVALTLMGFLFSVHSKTLIVNKCRYKEVRPWEGGRLDMVMNLRSRGIRVIPSFDNDTSTEPIYDIHMSKLIFDEMNDKLLIRLSASHIQFDGDVILAGDEGGFVELRPADIGFIRARSNVDDHKK